MINFIQIMNNIRKLKKKKPVILMNPEELAQQKLFEISRNQDHEPKDEEADIFLQAQFTQAKIAPIHKEQQVERSSTYRPADYRNTRMPSILSMNSFKRKSGEIKIKKQLPLTNYLVIDEREKSFSQSRQKSARYDIVDLMKQKTQSRKIKVRSVPMASRSSELKKQEAVDKIASLRGNLVYAIQIRNIKLGNKYPFFMDH